MTTEAAVSDPILAAVLELTADTRVMPDPAEFDLDSLTFGWRLCAVDNRSQHGFRWPYPGNWTHADGPFTPSDEACPSHVGDGICIAKTLQGAGSGGQRVGASTGLLVAWFDEDLLGQNDAKLRVRAAWVADTFNPVSALVASKSNLRSANLRSADLRYADLRSANLRYANLTYANLTYANLTYANLTYADLTSATANQFTLFPADFDRAAAGVISV